MSALEPDAEALDALDPLAQLEAEFAAERERAARRRPAWLVPIAVAAGGLVLAVYLQIALAIDGRVLGAVPDLTALMVVMIALRWGGAWGAAAGFVAGLLADAALQLPLGAAALVLVPIGWACGAFARSRRRVSLGMALAVVGAAALAHALGDAALEAAIGGQAIAWGDLVVRAVAAAMATVLVGLVVVPLLRRVLGVPERSAL